MYYLVYKTTNLITGQYYIGAHSTKNLEDAYIGSGKYLRRAISKYGKQNFHREILHFAKSKDDMFAKEKELVNEDLIIDEKSYNLKLGGSGGNPGIIGAFAGKRHSEKTLEKIRVARKNQKPMSNETREKISKNNFGNTENGRKHLSEINKNIPKSKEHRKSLSLAQLGKRMINNSEINTFVGLDELQSFLELGWKLGRK